VAVKINSLTFLVCVFIGFTIAVIREIRCYGGTPGARRRASI
jgi:hypothetical protein